VFHALDIRTIIFCDIALYSFGGLVLDYTVVSYKGVAVFQPVINGRPTHLIVVSGENKTGSFSPAELRAFTQTRGERRLASRMVGEATLTSPRLVSLMYVWSRE